MRQESSLWSSFKIHNIKKKQACEKVITEYSTTIQLLWIFVADFHLKTQIELFLASLIWVKIVLEK